MGRVRAPRLPRGLRDTRNWYRDTDAMVAGRLRPRRVRPPRTAARACSTWAAAWAATARRWATAASTCCAFDVVPEYVERARSLGVAAELYDGKRLPLADGSRGHRVPLRGPGAPGGPGRACCARRAASRAATSWSRPRTARRASRRVPIEFSHMLDVDHRQFFTVESLGALLGEVFERLRGRAGPPARREDRRARAAAARCGALHRWLDRGGRRASRATSFACAPAARAE